MNAYDYFSIDLDEEALNDFAELVTVQFCNENATPMIQTATKPKATRSAKRKAEIATREKKKAERDRKAKEKSTVNKALLFDLDAVLYDTFHGMSKNEMFQEMYGEIITRISIKPYPNIYFLCAPFQEALDRKSFSFDNIWKQFNKIWTNETIIHQVIDCLCVPKEFCSWLLLAMQETIIKKYLETDELQPTIEVILTEDEKETVAYICGAVIKKLINKAYDNIRRADISSALGDALKARIKILGSCQMPKGKVEGSSKLIETLNRGGLSCPCESFVSVFLHVEKTFRKSVYVTKTKIKIPEIIAKCMQDGNLSEKFLCMTSETIASSEIKLNTLNSCITLYVKIRAYGHAKHLIEKHRHDSKKERKEKALRKKLKTSHEEIKK